MFFRQLARVRLKHITAGFTTSHAINASRRYGRYYLTPGCRMPDDPECNDGTDLRHINQAATTNSNQQLNNQQPIRQ
jgi:hypothetical protein